MRGLPVLPILAEFAGLNCDTARWAGKTYSAEDLNLDDPMVKLTEKIAARIVTMLKSRGFTRRSDPYLERYVDEVLNG